MEQQKTRMPAIFVGHGSPMIALEHNDLTATYKELGQTILKRFGRPKAILMISAHWYTRGTLVQSAEKPRQVYDMYGFPKELYELKYEPAGCADLTKEVTDLLGDGVEVDDSWGIDHGTWSILVHIFPRADIPVVQLSVNGLMDTRQSYELGQRLAVLREKGYLLMGSGNVVHNLRLVEWENEHGSLAADRFDEAIKSAIEARDDEAVIEFHRCPDADYAVPTPDHFLPLLYILGAARDEKPYIFNNVRNLGSMALTGYAFGL
ncbi:4,5-DOPA dioxygenase extradiol [Mitsuokella sp. AF21-1AC]|uniref:4,5-DOPA-extradiol-dioxygenase n=1 Tax=Mitsuokella sp. AF21-1AC TaxID=2292235 RepID=UPI000E4E8D3D|nr:4,5-DOPA dioxygenase extradiol [Mitsuokella sp. AF21-1AC]RGS74315.1 4,5-DOPA dioxygenase extradiol [Mitsuokella sp. AF21-1AC]